MLTAKARRTKPAILREHCPVRLPLPVPLTGHAPLKRHINIDSGPCPEKRCTRIVNRYLIICLNGVAPNTIRNTEF